MIKLIDISSILCYHSQGTDVAQQNRLQISGRLFGLKDDLEPKHN